VKRLIAFLLCMTLLCGCTAPQAPPKPTACITHADNDDNGTCDLCNESVLVVVDFYNINDLHGKFADTSEQPGVNEMTTYFKKVRTKDDHVVLLSTGDTWQGSSESNLTGGLLMTDWMNQLDFAAMALGNHEFDWGEDAITKNAEFAEFPLLAINIYDRDSHKQVDYCQSSTMVDLGELQIGIIGAIGDCYSSIAADKVEDVYFKTGEELTNLVMLESLRLRNQGSDYIVYLLHDGYGDSESGNVKPVTGSRIASYYDTSLSDGFVDLVFEGHTHQKYILKDEYGVYHLQNRGENKGGISHVEVSINTVTGSSSINDAAFVTGAEFERLNGDPIVPNLMEKYGDEIAPGLEVLGSNAYQRSSNELRQLVADLYYQLAEKHWGDEYDIVLGGGYLSVRAPYELPQGDVTYGQLQMLFPFDNPLVLCSIKGRDLQDRFFKSQKNYYISYGEYGAQVERNVDPNATYYVLVDSYSSLYAPNKLTEIARYDETTFARDLLAEYIKKGGLAQ